jgi:branched-subunit amino acid transport protein
MALTATGGLLGSQLIMGVISLYSEAFEPQRWQQFLIYIGYTIFAFIINAFANKALPYVNQAALIWSLLGFTVICITVRSSSIQYKDGITHFFLRFSPAAALTLLAPNLSSQTLSTQRAGLVSCQTRQGIEGKVLKIE